MTGTRPLSAQVLSAVPREVRVAASAPKESHVPEPEEHIRLVLAEALLLLCKGEEGRDALRADAAYEVLREWHLEEQSDRVRDVIEGVVARTKLVDEM